MLKQIFELASVASVKPAAGSGYVVAPGTGRALVTDKDGITVRVELDYLKEKKRLTVCPGGHYIDAGESPDGFDHEVMILPWIEKEINRRLKKPACVQAGKPGDQENIWIQTNQGRDVSLTAPKGA